MKKKVKILKAEAIPTDKIKDGDVRSFALRVADTLIKKGIAEEYQKEKQEQKKLNNEHNIDIRFYWRG
jgi:hypothetical protein